VPKPPQAANQKSNISSTYDWLMKKHVDGSTASITGEEPSFENAKPLRMNSRERPEYKPEHICSFGNFQSASHENLNNP
jgi:hypothetical protein